MALLRYLTKLLKREPYVSIRVGTLFKCPVHGDIAWIVFSPEHWCNDQSIYSLIDEHRINCGAIEVIPEIKIIPTGCYYGFHRIKKGEFHGWRYEVCLRCGYERWSVKGPAVVSIPHPSNMFSSYYKEWQELKSKLKS